MFHTVYEFHFCLNEKERLRLYGTLAFDEVSQFHETLKTYGVGNHAAARVWAKQQKKLLGPRCGAIKLNAKIDSKRQRRLQCSARLSELVDACEKTICFPETGTEKGPAEYRGLPLPYVVVSSSREFS